MMANTGPTETAPTAKQLVFLAMMATVVAVVVFLCGVLVGRGVPVRRAMGIAATEPAPNGAGAPGRGMPAIVPESGEASGSPLDDLSYFGRLNDPEPPPETLEAPAPLLAAAPAVDAAADPRPASSPPDAAAFVVQVTALRAGDAARAVVTTLVAKGYPAFVVDPVPGAPVAVYRVRVGPYSSRDEAETVRQRLETEERFKPWLIQL